jgi:hypothetical protein
MSSPDSTIVKIREFVIHGFRILPIVLASFAFIIGVGHANMAFFFLFVGIALIVPIANMLSNKIFGWLFSLGVPEALYKISAAPGSGCSVFGEFANTGDTASYWLAALIFFVSYTFINAYHLYNRPAQPNAPENKVDARKTQAIMAIALILMFGIGMLLYRFFTTKCETALGMPVALLVFVPIAYYWYSLLESCSGDRLTDLFGVVNRIMIEPKNAGAGAVCMPIA